MNFKSGLHIVSILLLAVLILCSLSACGKNRNNTPMADSSASGNGLPDVSIIASPTQPSISPEAQAKSAVPSAAFKQLVVPVQKTKTSKTDENGQNPTSETSLSANYGKLIGSDDLDSFYLANGIVHIVNNITGETDPKGGDTFAYNSNLYFSSRKGIYTVKSDGTGAAALLEEDPWAGTGSTYINIHKVENGTIFATIVGFHPSNIQGAGDSLDACFQISGDPAWTLPKPVGQKNGVGYYVDKDNSIYCMAVIHGGLVGSESFLKELMTTPVQYNGYIYFVDVRNFNSIFRVMPNGQNFECYFTPYDSEVSSSGIEIIEKSIIYYYEYVNNSNVKLEKTIPVK